MADIQHGSYANSCRILSFAIFIIEVPVYMRVLLSGFLLQETLINDRVRLELGPFRVTMIMQFL
jgi:hypothetical protein